jgi:hypothetical protein
MAKQRLTLNQAFGKLGNQAVEPLSANGRRTLCISIRHARAAGLQLDLRKLKLKGAFKWQCERWLCCAWAFS